MTDYARTMTGWMDGPFLGWDQKSDDELTQTGFRRPLGVRWPPESITTFSSPAAGCRPPDIIGSPKCSSDTAGNSTDHSRTAATRLHL